jgi:hypothetical protein
MFSYQRRCIEKLSEGGEKGKKAAEKMDSRAQNNSSLLDYYEGKAANPLNLLKELTDCIQDDVELPHIQDLLACLAQEQAQKKSEAGTDQPKPNQVESQFTNLKKQDISGVSYFQYLRFSPILCLCTTLPRFLIKPSSTDRSSTLPTRF